MRIAGMWTMIDGVVALGEMIVNRGLKLFSPKPGKPTENFMERLARVVGFDQVVEPNIGTANAHDASAIEAEMGNRVVHRNHPVGNGSS